MVTKVRTGGAGGVSIRSLAVSLVSSSPGSALSAAYSFWANGDFGECLEELDSLDATLTRADATEAALLRARVYLRLEQPDSTIAALTGADSGEDVDVNCCVRSLRGLALVSAGRSDDGMQMLRSAAEEAMVFGAIPSIRLEALYHIGFGHWLLRQFDHAASCAMKACDPRGDVISARAIALRAWSRVAQIRFDEALTLFRDARRAYRSSVGRDAAFDASLAHAEAMYALQLLDRDDEPNYYSDTLPAPLGRSLETYRLLVARIDAWRAALHGDAERAIEFAAVAGSANVSMHWRIYGLVTQAAIARAFGHDRFGRAYSRVALASAAALDWDQAPGESRFALLYLAEELASYDPPEAFTVLSRFARISRTMEPRFLGGEHPFRHAAESFSRGVVALALEEPNAFCHLTTAYETYEMLGFRWRAAETQALLGQTTPHSETAAYRAAEAFIVDRFPHAYFAQELHGCGPWLSIKGSVPLTPAHVAIIRFLSRGMTPREIAADRGTSLGTVYNQLKEIYRRTDLHSIQAVVAKYLRLTA
jgi:DNA-binding CsgD family transcriptional regulator